MSVRSKSHFKDAYEDVWEVSRDREFLICDILSVLGYQPVLQGFGAGSTEYIEGSATDNDKDKSEPDVYLTQRDVHIEVTGSDKKSVRPESDLWVRDDKLDYADKNRNEDVWVAHIVDGEGLIRVMEATDAFIKEFHYETETITVDTVHSDNEEFIPIDHNHESVESFHTFLEHIGADESRSWSRIIAESFFRWKTIDDIFKESNLVSLALQIVDIDTTHGTKYIDVVDRERQLTDISVNPYFDFPYDTLETGSWFFFTNLDTYDDPDDGFSATQNTSVTPIDPLFNTQRQPNQ